MIHGTALRFAISIGLIPARPAMMIPAPATGPVSYTHLRAHET